MLINQELAELILDDKRYNMLLLVHKMSSGRSYALKDLREYLIDNGMGSFADDGRGVRNYLSKLEELEIIRVDKSSKPYQFKIREDLTDLTEVHVSRKNFPILIQWKRIIEKYSALPLFDELNALVESNYKHGLDEFDSFLIADFESSHDYEGLENIDLLYNAIRDREEINFTYQPFDESAYPVEKFRPHLLKEHNRRWYIVGNYEKGGTYFNYALDRIVSVDENAALSLFERDKSFDPSTHWKYALGIYQNGEPTNISFELKDGSLFKNIPYLKTAPLCEDQTIKAIEGTEWVRVELFMIPGPELVRALRSFGMHNVRDIEPEWFGEEVLEA